LAVCLQIILTLLVLVLWHTSFVQPIKLLVVLLHEMSHGLMALASGGAVYDIVITPQEGGACQSEGGNALLVAGAGYLGSMFFGGMILRAARGGSSVPITFALLTLLVLGAAVTVLHDPYSRTFGLSLAGLFILVGLLAPSFLGALFLRAIGTVSCLYAIFDIYSDVLVASPLAGSIPNDAETFASLTGLSVDAVGIGWLVVSVLFFVAILKASLETAPAPVPSSSPAQAAGASS
jgi:hypothetical protein